MVTWSGRRKETFRMKARFLPISFEMKLAVLMAEAITKVRIILRNLQSYQPMAWFFCRRQV